jgi:hypothetical protein
MSPKIRTTLKPSLKSIGENTMYHEEKKKGKSHYSDSNMKPDKTCHYKNEDMGTMAKKAKLPGQMYVPQPPDHNESDFAGEKR